MGRDRLRLPPSALTGELYNYLTEVWRAVNDIPNLSYFSGATPNSRLTGVPGDVGINPNSGSTAPRMWIMGGTSTSGVTQGWLPVVVGEP